MLYRSNDIYRYLTRPIEDPKCIYTYIAGSLLIAKRRINEDSDGNLLARLPNPYKVTSLHTFNMVTYPVVENLSYIHALKAVDSMWEWSRTHISDGGIEVDINISWCPIGLATLRSKKEDETSAVGSGIS